MSDSKMFSNLYLEHYLESLESLPEELKRNFTLMYELDVKSKSILENLDAASDEYLRKVRELSPERRKIEMEKIQAMFKKSKEHGDNKVKIAIKTYELVDKHIRRLDSDLAKFESEMKEKGRLSQSEDEELDEEEMDDNKPLTKNSKVNKKSLSKQHQQTHKKSDSKKAAKDSSSCSSGTNKRNKDSKDDVRKKKSKNPNTVLKKDESLLPELSKGPQEVLDMPVDPNEPTYCTCHQVSYGEMIGCDNVDCPIEWFHFGCMGLNTKPKGRWYCPLCSHMFKKKK